MELEELKKLPDYNFELDRNKIRFNGIGPRLHEQPGEIWPRDYAAYDREHEKILHPEIKALINNQTHSDRIEGIIKRTFSGLRRINVGSLFNTYCPLDIGHFDKIPFKMNHAMDAFTDYKKINLLIHNVITSALNYHNRSNNDNFFLTFFGCDQNYRIFKRHVNCLVSSNVKVRKVLVGHLVSFGSTSMNLDKMSWLIDLNPIAKYRVFIQIIYAVFRYLYELLRRYFHITLSNPYLEMLFYYRYDLWQKIQSLGIRLLIEQEVLVPIKLEQSVQLSTISCSKLKFFLKRDSLRLICTKFKDSGNRLKYNLLQAILRFILKNSPVYKPFNLNYLLDGLKHFKRISLAEHKKIYFVRADIKNCFQSIQQELLRHIILDYLESYLKGDKLKLHKYSCPLGKKKTFINKWYVDQDKPTTRGFNLDPIPRCESHEMSIQEFDRDYLKPHILEPVLRESLNSKNGFRLVNGIRQGATFSPILCSIYIQQAFEQYIKEYLDAEDCKVFRWVDDILFMSSDLTKAREFMERTLNGFRDYNLRMNLSKLECNFTCRGLNESLCRPKNNSVTFFKQIISMDTLQCSYDYSYGENLELEYTFKVSPYKDKEAIKYSISRSKIDLIHLDIELNGLEQVIKNIFERALLLAHRIATMIMTSLELRKLENQNGEFMMELLEMTAKRIYKAINLNSSNAMTKLTLLEVHLIVATAFEVTWRNKKVTHRMIEREKIKSASRRYMMRVLIHHQETTSDPFSRPIDWENEIKKLIIHFPKTVFKKVVITS